MEKKKYACLKCNKKFESEGSHNRICYQCKDLEIFSGMVENKGISGEDSNGNYRVFPKL
jgi:hypothetical protein